MRSAILFVAVLTVGLPAAASESADVVKVVHQFIDAFNKSDTKALVATCAPQVAIIDEFAPYVWAGPTACADWAKDFDADAGKNGITDPKVTVGKPRHVDITGDRAYVVGPADYTFKLKGKPMSEKGSIFTLALQKLADGWRITGWAWAKH
jgi:ketosteroid isomerase-like protein